MAVSGIQLKGDALIWALGAIAQLNRIPFDPKLILQQFPPPYASETLHEAATNRELSGPPAESRHSRGVWAASESPAAPASASAIVVVGRVMRTY